MAADLGLLEFRTHQDPPDQSGLPELSEDAFV
jgi:hypothetical protein